MPSGKYTLSIDPVVFTVNYFMWVLRSTSHQCLEENIKVTNYNNFQIVFGQRIGSFAFYDV